MYNRAELLRFLEQKQKAIAATRDKFVRNRSTHASTKIRISFKQLLWLFLRASLDPEYTQARLSREKGVGVCQERVRQLNNEYFAKLMPPPAQRQKWVEGWKRQQLRSKERAIIRSVPVFRRIAAEASKAKLSFALVSRNYAGRVAFRMKAVLIGGQVCGVHVLTESRQTSSYPARYSRIRLIRKTTASHFAEIVLRCLPRRRTRLFVVPCDEFLPFLNGKKSGMFFVREKPLTKASKTNTFPRINFWRFENGWWVFERRARKVTLS